MARVFQVRKQHANQVTPAAMTEISNAYRIAPLCCAARGALRVINAAKSPVKCQRHLQKWQWFGRDDAPPPSLPAPVPEYSKLFDPALYF